MGQGSGVRTRNKNRQNRQPHENETRLRDKCTTQNNCEDSSPLPPRARQILTKKTKRSRTESNRRCQQSFLSATAYQTPRSGEMKWQNGDPEKKKGASALPPPVPRQRKAKNAKMGAFPNPPHLFPLRPSPVIHKITYS